MTAQLYLALLAVLLVQLAGFAVLAILMSRLWKVARKRGLPPASDRVAWGQIESFISLQRAIDGKPTLPQLRTPAPDFVMHVVRHIEREAPRVILECGAGASTVALAAVLRAFGRPGHIYALECHAALAEDVRRQLQAHGLGDHATVVTVDLAEQQRPGKPDGQFWYDLGKADFAHMPGAIDLLIVNGTSGEANGLDRYPVAPELFPKLAAGAHVFVDDTDRPDENLRGAWRKLYPDLGVRDLPAERGALEMFFLDQKIEAFMKDGQAAA